MKRHWALRLYPRAWQSRYADEVQAVLEVTPATWRTTWDLVSGAAHERVTPSVRGLVSLKAVRWSELIMLGLVQWATVAFRELGWLAGSAMAAAGTAIQADFSFVLMTIHLAASTRAMAAFVGSAVPKDSRLRTLMVGRREFAVWAVCLLAASSAGGLQLASGPDPYWRWWNVSYLTLLATGSARFARLSEVSTNALNHRRRLAARRAGLSPLKLRSGA